MNKQLVLQTKEYMLEVLDWTNNPNRKLALECINEIADQVLQDMNEYLREVEKLDSVLPPVEVINPVPETKE